MSKITEKTSVFNADNFGMKKFVQHIHCTQLSGNSLASAADFAASHLLNHNNGGLIAALKHAWRNNKTNSAKLEAFFELNDIEFEKVQFNTGIKDAEKRDIITPFRPKNCQPEAFFVSFDRAEEIVREDRKKKRAADNAAKKEREAELLAKAVNAADTISDDAGGKKGAKTPMIKAREAILSLEKASALMTMEEKKELAVELLRLIAHLGESKDAASLALTSTLEGEKIAIN
jgi:hypothetical protein